METKSTLLTVFVQYVLPILVTALLLLMKLGLALWIKHRSEQHKDGKAAALFNKFLAVMQVTVADVEQTLKPKLIEASKDGTITKEEGEQLRAEALKLFWAYIGDKGKKDAADVLGIVAPSLESLVGSMLESAVSKLPAVAAAVATVTTTAATTDGQVVTTTTTDKPAQAPANP